MYATINVILIEYGFVKFIICNTCVYISIISFPIATSLSEGRKEDLSDFLSKYKKVISEGRQYTILILCLYLVFPIS